MVEPAINGPRTGLGENVTAHWEDVPPTGGQGTDGLPGFSVQQQGHVVPLTHETLVCQEDRRELVLRDAFGEVVARFTPEEATRTESRVDLVPLDLAIRRAEGVTGFVAVLRNLTLRGVRVQPVRPVCHFYARQKVEVQHNPEHGEMQRICMARRDDEGMFVSVQNTAVYSCEIRQPYDAESMRRANEFDELKMQLGYRRVQEEGGYSVDVQLDRLRESARRDKQFADGGSVSQSLLDELRTLEEDEE